MFLEKLSLKVTKTDAVPPDEERSAEIFSRIGYRLEEALADLVDNSIDAEAKNVLVRFVRSSQGIHSVLIADDGEGMTEKVLLEAMRFGSRTQKKRGQLGKYGIGLKSASLSQAQTVTVVSKATDGAIGRRWTTENIKAGWKCALLNSSDCERLLSSPMGHIKFSKSGTVVLWERLEHLRAAPETTERILERAIKAASIELGIKFHRLLESKKVSICIDTMDITEEEEGIPIPVLPLNPFQYDASGAKGYPKDLKAILSRNRALVVRCHIWPPKMKSSGYRLGGGKVASRQGFYFYRNDRLIQAGGWNGLLADDSEPHMSLARVEIDLPPELDSAFQLNIAKSQIDPPPEFQPVLDAASVDGFNFRRYLKDADSAYRNQKQKDAIQFPYVPGEGFAKTPRQKIAKAFQETPSNKPREVAFKWITFTPDEVVRIESQALEIHLNKRYRPELIRGAGSDGALVKLLLLLLLQSGLGKAFQTQKTKDWLRRVNHALLASFET